MLSCTSREPLDWGQVDAAYQMSPCFWPERLTFRLCWLALLDFDRRLLGRKEVSNVAMTIVCRFLF